MLANKNLSELTFCSKNISRDVMRSDDLHFSIYRTVILYTILNLFFPNICTILQKKNSILVVDYNEIKKKKSACILFDWLFRNEMKFYVRKKNTIFRYVLSTRYFFICFEMSNLSK